MKKSFILLFCFNLIYSIPTNITIRNAVQEDLSAMLDLAKIVSYEYFLPLFTQEYSHLPLGKNSAYFLELELDHDKK